MEEPVLQPKTDKETITAPGTPGGFTPNPGHEDHVQALRTYSSDLAKAVKEQQGSIVKIAMAEEEKIREEKERTSPTSKKNLTYIASGALLLFLAVAAVVGILWYKNKQNTVPAITTTLPPSLIRAEEADTLDITGKAKEEVILDFRGMVANPNIRLGTIKNIVITQKKGIETLRVPASEFLSFISPQTPPQFNRTLSDEYMLGIHLYDHSNPFLILQGTAHDFLVAGMLEWEPHLLSDMAPLFGIDLSVESNIPANTSFSDDLIQNRDVRIIKNKNGDPILFYAFLDQNTVIITNDSKTLTEAVRRFVQ